MNLRDRESLAGRKCMQDPINIAKQSRLWKVIQEGCVSSKCKRPLRDEGRTMVGVLTDERNGQSVAVWDSPVGNVQEFKSICSNSPTLSPSRRLPVRPSKTWPNIPNQTTGTSATNCKKRGIALFPHFPIGYHRLTLALCPLTLIVIFDARTALYPHCPGTLSHSSGTKPLTASSTCSSRCCRPI